MTKSVKMKIASLLCLIMIFQTWPNNIGVQKAQAANGFLFEADMLKSLSDRLELIDDKNGTSRPTDIFLYWDFETLEGSQVLAANYELSYHLENGKKIIFTVEKKTVYATVSYRVETIPEQPSPPEPPVPSTCIDPNLDNFYVYKEQTASWVNPTTITLPNISSTHGVIYDTVYGKPIGAGISDPAHPNAGIRFNIEPGAGYAFRFDNRTVRFIWSDSVFYFVTDGAAEGKIYPFRLKATKPDASAASVDSSLELFTGVSGVTSQPTAEPRTPATWNRLDQINGNDPDPATAPGLNLSFDAPLVWDNISKFVYTPPTADPSVMGVVIDLPNIDTSKSLTVYIDDVFDPSAAGKYRLLKAASSTAAIHAPPSLSANHRITVVLTGLEPGLIFDPASIILQKRDMAGNAIDTFYSAHKYLERGLVYTYLRYAIEGTSVDQFYIKIYTYKHYTGFYTVNNVESQRPWAEVEDKNGTGAVLTIPISVNPIIESENWFNVVFTLVSPDNRPGAPQVNIASQTIGYRATLEALTLQAPSNLKVTTNIITEDDGEYLLANITWDIARHSLMDVLYANNVKNFEYHFLKSLLNDTSDGTFAKVNVSVGESVYTITNSDPNLSELVMGEVLFSEPILINNANSNSPDNTMDYMLKGHIQVKLPTRDASLPVSGTEPILFYYPNVYKIWAAYYSDPNDPVEIPRLSSAVNITIDKKSETEAPPPQNIQIKNITTNGFDAVWDTVTAQVYNRYYEDMLEPRRLIIKDDSITFNLFLSQDKEHLEQLTNDWSGKTDQIIDEMPIYKMNYSSSTIHIKTDSTEALKHLRNGEIIKITGVPNDLTAVEQVLSYTGLDKNEIYYLTLETKITPYRANGSISEEDAGLSKLSALVSVTTKDIAPIPSPEERIPPSPTNFTVDEKGEGHVRLYWDKIDTGINADNANEKIEFELFKIVNSQADATQLQRRDPFKTFWDAQSQLFMKAGLLTDIPTPKEWNGSAFQDDVKENQYRYDPTTHTNGHLLTDYTLLPNQVYYYYIRTVRVDKTTGDATAYSTWVPLTVTTSPIKSPVNLKVLREGHSYDKKTEMVIGFDAPLADIGQLGDVYDLQYQIKQDGEEWQTPVTMNPSDLTASESTLDGYTHFIYKISGLKPNTGYSVRVRLVDKIFGDESLYSNVDTTRTDYDPEDYDTDTDTNKWYDQFEREAKEILKRPYWRIEEGRNNFEAVYRTSMFNAELARVTSSYQLGGQDKDNQIYYIPAAALQAANSTGKGFTVRNGIMETAITPNAVSADQTDAIKKMLAQIQDKNVQDYYIRLSLRYSEITSGIEGGDPLSDQVQIKLEVTGSRALEKTIDKEIEAEFLARLADTNRQNDIKSKLSKEVQDNATTEELALLVSELVVDFDDEFSDYVDTKMNNNIRTTYAVETLTTPIMLTIKPENPSAAAAYEYYANEWFPLPALTFGDKVGIDIYHPGVFIFTGRVIVIPGVSDMYNGSSITKIVGQYGLDDFFGKGQLFNVNAPVTYQGAYGSIARMAGASNSADSISFLRGKGLNVSSRNIQTAITNQEAIYVTMWLYEVKTNTKVAAVRITNYGAIQNMSAVNPNYKPYLQAAMETGIWIDGSLDPRGQMKVKDFLDMLGRLSTKAHL